MFEITDNQKEGVGSFGTGLIFIFLGGLLWSDRVLLAMGNIMLVSGLVDMLGVQRQVSFFSQRHKIKATLFFFGGIFVLDIGWRLVGMYIKLYCMRKLQLICTDVCRLGENQVE